MKKTGVICRILCYILALLIIAAPVRANSIAEEDLSITKGCRTIDAQVPMLDEDTQLSNVYSAFLYDYTNDMLLFAQNPDLQFYPASLVKIMTGLLIVNEEDLDVNVTVQQSVLDTVPSASRSLNLKDGEVLTLRDLFYAIIVQSSNEAAAVAANHISGSQEAFVSKMNATASELGCTNTFFVNPHGLHDAMQLTTARDMARILSAAVNNEAFVQAFSTIHYTIPASNMSDERKLSSGNYLMNGDLMSLYLDSRVTGGRSGVMDSGERNLAVTAEYNNVKLISIVSGAKSELNASGNTVTYGSFLETTALLDMGFKGYHSVQLFYKDQVLKQYDVINGESCVATGVRDAVFALLPQGATYNDLTYLYNENNTVIHAPVLEGDVISTVQIWHDDLCLAQAKLYALHDVNKKQVVVTEDTVENTESESPRILIIVAIIVCLLFALLLSRRLIFSFIRRQQIKRHRRNRRRSR